MSASLEAALRRIPPFWLGFLWAVLLLVGLAAALEPDSSWLLLLRMCFDSSRAALLFVLATTAASIAAKGTERCHSECQEAEVERDEKNLYIYGW